MDAVQNMALAILKTNKGILEVIRYRNRDIGVVEKVVEFLALALILTLTLACRRVM